LVLFVIIFDFDIGDMKKAKALPYIEEIDETDIKPSISQCYYQYY